MRPTVVRVAFRVVTRRLLACALLVLVAATGHGTATAKATAKGNGNGTAAPDFVARDLAGQEVTLSTLRGQVVVIDFWASWCGPCKKSLPALAEIARRCAARGAVFLAVNLDEDRKNVERFLKQTRLDGLRVLLDPGGNAVAARYEPPSMPTTYLIDRDGVIRYVHAGYKPGDEQRLERELAALLK